MAVSFPFTLIEFFVLAAYGHIIFRYNNIQTCGVALPCELPIIIMCIPGFSNVLSLHLVVNYCHKMAQLQQSVNIVELQ